MSSKEFVNDFSIPSAIDTSDWQVDDYVSFDGESDFSGKVKVEYRDGDIVTFSIFDEDGEKISEVQGR